MALALMATVIGTAPGIFITPFDTSPKCPSPTLFSVARQWRSISRGAVTGLAPAPEMRPAATVGGPRHTSQDGIHAGNSI